MSVGQKQKIAPFVSILFLVVIAVGTVFLKMETVREGYELVRLGRFQKMAADEKAHHELLYARLTRPERLDLIATKRLALTRAQKNQVVLMAAHGGIAIRQ